MTKVIQIRLEGESEQLLRQQAKEFGIQVSRVKKRNDCIQLYGVKLVEEKIVRDAQDLGIRDSQIITGAIEVFVIHTDEILATLPTSDDCEKWIKQNT